MDASRPAAQIIFDLDGTLVQTRIASWEIFREVNDEFHLGIDDERKYFALWQGNLFEAVRELCADEAKANAVTQSFMRRLQENYFPQMIPGMVDVIHALAPRATLAVLSSNTTSVVRRILSENGLAYCFAHVFCGDVEPSKVRGIKRFLANAASGTGRRCEAPYDEAAQGAGDSGRQNSAVLVTDTIGDVAAAKAAGIRAIGVSWGMHSKSELLDAGAEFVAIWPQELVSYLRASSEPPSQTDGSCQINQVSSLSPDLIGRAASIRNRRRVSSDNAKISSVSSGSSCGCGAQTATSAPPVSIAMPHPTTMPEVPAELLGAVRRIML